MAKVLVIVRHLQNHSPVACTVITKPTNEYLPTEMSDDEFVRSESVQKMADSVIERFKDNFIEFKDADFYKYFVDTVEPW